MFARMARVSALSCSVSAFRRSMAAWSRRICSLSCRISCRHCSMAASYSAGVSILGWDEIVSAMSFTLQPRQPHDRRQRTHDGSAVEQRGQRAAAAFDAEVGQRKVDAVGGVEEGEGDEDEEVESREGM